MRKVDLLRNKLQKLVNLMTQKKVKVTQSGTEANTSFDAKTGAPKVINIPQIPDDADDALLAAIEGYVDHEVGHVLYTDPQTLAQSKKNQMLAQMMNMVEDSRIERKIMDSYSGSGYNLSRTAELYEKESVDPIIQNKYAPQEMINSALICPAIRAWAGCHQFVDYMADKWGLIPQIVAKAGEYAKKELPNIKTTADSLRVAKGILKLLDVEHESEDPQNDSDQNEDQESDSGDGSGQQGGKPEKSDKGDESDKDKEGKDQNQDQQDDEEESDKKDKSTKWFDKSKGSDVFSNAMKEGIKQKIESLQTDNAYKVFSKDFDVIKPIKVLQGLEHSKVESFESSVRNTIGVIQKKLERAISAKSLGYWVGGHKSGRLNASSLSRFVVRNDERIFKRKHVSNTKDTAVTLLVDCSGSMSGSRIRLASQSAYALITALERMNIKNEVLGFTTGEYIETVALNKGYNVGNYNFSDSRERILVTYIIKSFSERFTYENKARLTVMSRSSISMYDNADGESVMIAANRLLERSEARKILIVLSDGQPNSAGYVNFDKHLTETVKYIETQTPIDIVGIGIESRAVRNFYKNHIILNDVESLPTTCLDQLQKILLK